MQQTYSTGKDIYENKKEPVKIMYINDPGHPAFSRNSYLAMDRYDQKNPETKNNPGIIMHDIFGALNY